MKMASLSVLSLMLQIGSFGFLYLLPFCGLCLLVCVFLAFGRQSILTEKWHTSSEMCFITKDTHHEVCIRNSCLADTSRRFQWDQRELNEHFCRLCSICPLISFIQGCTVLHGFPSEQLKLFYCFLALHASGNIRGPVCLVQLDSVNSVLFLERKSCSRSFLFPVQMAASADSRYNVSHVEMFMFEALVKHEAPWWQKWERGRLAWWRGVCVLFVFLCLHLLS